MKKYLIVELPDNPSQKSEIRSDILFTLRKYGGRLYDSEDLVTQVSAEQAIPTFYCEVSEQKEMRPIIESSIAVAIAKSIRKQGLIKFTEQCSEHGTRIQGTLSVFVEEVQ